MSKNKLAKFDEMANFPHVFQISSKEILNGQKLDFQGNWHKNIFKNHNPIILELGCGKGEYTVELAARYSDRNFIGVDIKGARIWTGAKKSFEAAMKNVSFIRTDIEMINRFFATDEVSEIWLTFPDPQMKKVNKRLTSTNFMRLYQQFIVNKGIIHLKTDSNFLFSYTKEMIKVNDYQAIAHTDNLYSAPLSDPILGIKTFYEQQWLNRGISIKYIAFKLDKKEFFFEPNVEIEKDDYRSFGRQAVVDNL